MESISKGGELSHVGLILQYLHEHGFEGAFHMLQEESGEKFDVDAVRLGGQLETILLLHEDNKLREEISELEGKSKERQENSKLLEPGDGNFVKQVHDAFEGIHNSNILSVGFHRAPDSKLIATGSTDRTVKITNYETKQTVKQFGLKGAVLSTEFNPKYHNILLTTGMDGSHNLLDVETGNIIQSFNEHTKYVVNGAWHKDGLIFATASHDHSVCIYKAESIESGFKLSHKINFLTNAESVTFNSTGQLVIGVREDNYLHFIDLNTFSDTKFNMNATLDDHISFSALDVNFSPDENYILVSTDRDRVIMYRIGNSTPVRNFWGTTNDMYSQPRNCWHSSGKYVYSTSQDNKVYCWEVATQNIVQKLEGHKSTVRDLQMHPSRGLLATVSFDKTVKLWN